MIKCTTTDLRTLAAAALERAGASSDAARLTADALVAAEAAGISSHGLVRVAQYAGHLRHGRTNGKAQPRILAERPAACLVDANDGLAYPACALAVDQAIVRASSQGMALAAVTRSHHFGVAAWHLGPVAAAGMVGLAFSNSPAAMPAWGGKHPLFGTNPVAAVFPRAGHPPLVIDMALSEVARGKLLVASRAGRPIPLGWALDRHGNPTTDAQAGLDGMLLPAGGAKGAMLALVVELLASALTGAALGFEADSLFSDEGAPPRLGQVFLVINPGALAGHSVYFERIESLVEAMLQDDGVRLPGGRREHQLQIAEEEGIAVNSEIITQLRNLAGLGAD